MLKKDPNYRRLKLGGRGTVSSSSYWLGPDHLLVVEVANYVERYRRFYFRDTQAILVQSSILRLLVNVICAMAMAMILVVFLLSMSGKRWSYPPLIALASLEIIPAMLLLVNILTGPTCKVYLRTAVQTQKLGSLSRWKKADLLIAELGPRIQAAQAVPTVAAPTTTPETVLEPISGPAVPVELPPDAPAPPPA